MKILHVCAGWEKWNGAANIARMIMGEQEGEGRKVSFATWASVKELRAADEVWIHCGWLPCLWWAALWGRNVRWMPEACYDPVRLRYHGWKKTLVGPIERWCLRRCVKIVATCEAEKAWIKAYLGRRCPPVEVTDIKRFFRLGNGERGMGNGERGMGNGKKDTLHILYLGRRHPLKGVEYLEAALGECEIVKLWKYEDMKTPNEGKGGIVFRIESEVCGEELEKVWEWCDVLALPTLSDNFGLVVAEALERGKRVITTDGAPAWEPREGEDERLWKSGTMEMWKCLGGRMLYLKGYRDGAEETRVELLRRAVQWQGNGTDK